MSLTVILFGKVDGGILVSRNTGSVSGGFAITTGIPPLMIPAFSPAIFLGCPQELGMVKTDVGDDTYIG